MGFYPGALRKTSSITRPKLGTGLAHTFDSVIKKHLSGLVFDAIIAGRLVREARHGNLIDGRSNETYSC